VVGVGVHIVVANKERLAELDENLKVHSRKKGWGLKAYYQGNEGLKTYSKEKE